MQFLADENFPGVAVELLRGEGHDVAWVLEDARGSPDPLVLARSVAERRTLLTFDKDFGAMVFQRGATASAGIVLFRILLPPDDIAAIVADTLGARDDWAGRFSVVEAGKIRMRDLPSSPEQP